MYINENDLFKSVFKASLEGILVLNKNGNILKSNPGCETIFGFKTGELQGKNLKDILPPEISKKFETAQKKTLQEKKIQILDYETITKHEKKFYKSRIVPLNSNNLLIIVRDVTSEKVNEKLLDTRNRALEAAGNGIIITDAQKPDLPIIYCNDSFEKITGYKKEEAYGINCRFLQNDDRNQEGIKIIRSAIENHEPCKVTLRNYRKDGTLFWNELTITPIHNSKGKLTHFIGVQHDVTEQKKEEYLKDQFRIVLEKITRNESIQAIGRVISETLETYFKNSIVAILLFNGNNNTLHKLAAPNLPKEVSNFVEGLEVGPGVGSCGTAAYTKKEVIVRDIKTDKLWRDYKEIALNNGIRSCWAFPILSSVNDVLGVLTIYGKYPGTPSKIEKGVIWDTTYLANIAIEHHNNTIDLKDKKEQLEKYAQELEDKVTERTQEVMATVQKLVEVNLNLEDQVQITKIAEEEAIKNLTMFSAIVKNFPRGIITVLNKDFEFLYADGEGLELAGLEGFTLQGRSIDDIEYFSNGRKTRLKRDVVNTLSGDHLSFEIEINNTHFSVNTAPLHENGDTITRALFVYSDITQQKNIEQDILFALHKEQELNELKSRFLSMASHEFRTPLSVILTSAELIQKQIEAGKPTENIKYLNKIVKNVSNLEVILNDFLSLSKLDEGKIISNPEEFDLIQLVKSIIKEFKINLKRGQIITIIKYDESITVKLDLKLLRQIIINLLSNASKYSREHTEINLTIANYPKHFKIDVTDQGIGIPEEDQKNLFHRFFRAKNAAGIEGTGIGLNIVRHYLELMEGTIEFYSELDKGSTFIIELPKTINR